MKDRSTRELWPADQEAWDAGMDELEHLIRDTPAAIAACRALIERAGTEELTGDDRAGLDELRLLMLDLFRALVAWQDYFGTLLAQSEPDLPLQWHVLLSERSSDAELSAAADEYASQVGLVKLLNAHRYDQHHDALEEAIADEVRGTTQTRSAVVRHAIAQAALVAAVEARTPQPSVTFQRRGPRARPADPRCAAEGRGSGLMPKTPPPFPSRPQKPPPGSRPPTRTLAGALRRGQADLRRQSQ